MAVVLSVVCSFCGTEHRPSSPWEAPGSAGWARSRAAAHGWTKQEDRGRTLDVCPQCRQGGGVVVRPPRQASGVVHAAVLAEDDVALCSWCEDGQHQWCSGCECTSGAHR